MAGVRYCQLGEVRGITAYFRLAELTDTGLRQRTVRFLIRRAVQSILGIRQVMPVASEDTHCEEALPDARPGSLARCGHDRGAMQLWRWRERATFRANGTTRDRVLRFHTTRSNGVLRRRFRRCDP